MTTNCPICGRPLMLLEQVLAEQNADYQCHHCWNRVHATGPVTPLAHAPPNNKPHIITKRRAAEVHRSKS